jgi:hypothetical protein
VIGRLSDIPLTAWWPVGTGLLVLGLLVALAAVRAGTRRLPRALLGLLSVVAVLASVGVGVNAHYGYFRTLGEALDAAPPGETTLDRVRAGARTGPGIGPWRRPTPPPAERTALSHEPIERKCRSFA